jgi:uncharacterized protein
MRDGGFAVSRSADPSLGKPIRHSKQELPHRRAGRVGSGQYSAANRTRWVAVLDALDAESVRAWSRAAVSTLEAHRSELDALNVFPVADADTGTNLALTFRAAAEGLAATETGGAGAALTAWAHHAVLGALGNSGVITAQLLRGLADVAGEQAGCDAVLLQAGLAHGVKEAYAAVRDPVDGTILSVARAAAEAAAGSMTLTDTAWAALSAAEQALLHTPDQLPVLARAGVVDAGGQGLVLILQALAEIVTGERSAPPPYPARRSIETQSADTGHAAPDAPDAAAATDYAYEIQYLLDADPSVVPALRDRLAGLGGSVAVVGTGAGVWNVHVHADDIGAAIEAGTDAGRPHRISVIRLPEAGQTDLGAAARRAAHGEEPAARSGTAVVAVAPGEGLPHLFQREGITVVDVGTDGRLSVDAVLAAVLATAAAEVVLLPNAERAGQISDHAAHQARALGVRVTVVPTRSPVQGLAAVAVHDSTRPFDEDVVAMAEAAAATRFAEVTTAESESLTTVGICQPGDVLGLIDGEVVAIGRGLVSVAFALIDRLLGVGAELMTLLVGRDAPAGVGEVLARHITERAPLTDVTVYAGGQPRYLLIIGVE